MNDRLLASLRAVDALVATERLSTDALVAAWKSKSFARGRDASEILEVLCHRGAPLPAEAVEGRLGALVLAWAEANAADFDLHLAPLFEAAEDALQPPSLLSRAARRRVEHGPPEDRLAALAFTGSVDWLDDDRVAASRVDLALWWAGRDGRSIPRLARWLFDHRETFRRMVGQRARKTLFDRILAARALATAADGYRPDVAAPGVLRPLRALILHADPLVWIPSAIALGRLAAHHRDARSWLFTAVESERLSERRRATCALAAMPGAEAWWTTAHVERLLDDKDDAWTIAAIGPALPHLIVGRRDLWEVFARRLRAEDGLAVWWSATGGLLAAHRRGLLDRTGRQLLAEARERAARETKSTAEALLATEIRARTDFLDDLDPDPTDVEGAMDRLVDVALGADPSRVTVRTQTLARQITATFDTASNVDGPLAPRLLAIESCARAAATGLYATLLTAADAEPNPIDRSTLLAHILETAANTLDTDTPSFALHRTALRVLGMVIDAEPSGENVRAVLRAIERPEWLRAPSKRQASRFKKPLGELVGRIVHAANLDPGDRDAQSKFLAWWCFAAASDEAVQFVARAETDDGGTIPRRMRTRAETLREVFADVDRAEDGWWRSTALDALTELGAQNTALRATVEAIANALVRAAAARNSRDSTKIRLAVIELGESTATLSELLGEPARALATDAEITWPNEAMRDLVATTVNALGSPERDDDALIERWRAPGGPLLGPVVEAAIRACFSTIRRSGSTWGDRTFRQIGPYRLETLLGRGAQGEVWRVTREPVGRAFVMKLLPARTAVMGTVEQDAMRVSLATEADLLKRMYHPNVANFVDFGWDDDQPYLVLEWLVGCDLATYHEAGPVTFDELRPIVEDTVNGLVAMHRIGLVHCDLKPGNIFLRLPLPPEAPHFVPIDHRYDVPLLGAVVIDFGVARTLAAAGGVEVVSGTPGYLAPEQTRGRVHPNTDVYALAATIFRTLTGRSFFEGIALGARILAHQERAPLDDTASRQQLEKNAPAALVELIDAATVQRPEDRPTVADFGARFAAI